jgi:pimeloyl-ACP methyl ester carboxylesterase
MSVPETLDLGGLSMRLWRRDHPEATAHTPLLLFLHGTLDTGRSWDAVVDAIVARDVVRTVAVDMRGHGQSSAGGPGASHHILDFTKDTAGVIHALEAQGTPVHTLVGHSMGANIALMLAGAWPSRIKGLVLVDGLGPPPEDAEDQPERLGVLLDAVVSEKKPFAPVNSIDDAIDRLRRLNPGLSMTGARRMLEHALVRDDDGALRFPFDRRLRGPTPVRHPEAMWAAFCARVGAGGVRSVVVRASFGYLPEGDAAGTLGSPFDSRLAALGGQLVQIEGPHHLHVEAPEAVADAVARAGWRGVG